MTKLETEAVHFAERCLEHKNKRDAKKVLERATKIIPYSGEIKKLLGGSIVR